jgi:hypothetical protein
METRKKSKINKVISPESLTAVDLGPKMLPQPKRVPGAGGQDIHALYGMDLYRSERFYTVVGDPATARAVREERKARLAAAGRDGRRRTS